MRKKNHYINRSSLLGKCGLGLDEYDQNSRTRGKGKEMPINAGSETINQIGQVSLHPLLYRQFSKSKANTLKVK